MCGGVSCILKVKFQCEYVVTGSAVRENSVEILVIIA